MKLCKDCIHYVPCENWSVLDSCSNSSLPPKFDNIRGEPIRHYCSEVRSSMGKCGAEGLLWEAKA